MSTKLRLIILSFLQFFIWGSWLITIGAYWFQTKQWSGSEFGAIFSTMGIASIFMPSLMGIVADKWMNAEKLYGILHILGGVVLVHHSHGSRPQHLLLGDSAEHDFLHAHAGPLALPFRTRYSSAQGLDVVKDYPPIRVWGTIGFIVAMWTVSLLGFEKSASQFYIAAAAAFALGIYSFTLPACPPTAKDTAQPLPGRCTGPQVVCPAARPQDAHLLPVRPAAGRGAAAHQRLRRHFPARF